MFDVIVFAIVGVAIVCVVLWRANRRPTTIDSAPHHHTDADNASRTSSGSAERAERERCRAQSRKDRRKRQ